MFIVRKTILGFFGCLLFFIGTAQRETFRSGPTPVKSIDEIRKLSSTLKAEETLKLIRNTNTSANKEVYDLVEESLQLAKDAERSDLVGGLLCGKGVLKLQETDTLAANELFQKAENYLERITDRRFIDNVMNALAIGYLRAGNSAKAIAFNLRLLSMYEDIPENRMRRLFAYRNLSNAYLRSQKKKEAITAMETAVSYAQQTSNETLFQDTKIAAALMYATLDDHKRSFAILKDIIPSINRLPQRAAENLYMVLADTYQKQGEYVKANEYYRKLTQSTNQTIVVSSYTQLLLNTDRTNEKDSAEKYYSALESAAFPNQRSTTKYSLAVSKYFAANNNSGKQIAYLRKAINDPKLPGAEAKLLLAKIYSAKGLKDSADLLFGSISGKAAALKAEPNLYGDYLSSLKQHQLRYKITDSLISVLNAELVLKDSLSKSNMFAITKDLETQYQVSEKENKLKQLAQQQKLDALQLKDQQQQTWIALLILGVVLAVFGAMAVVLQTKKKQAEKLHSLEVNFLNKKHRVELLQALEKAQEKERRSIADKLHDEVGAMLSVLKLNLSGVKNENASGEDKKLKTSLSIVDNLAGEIRNLSHTLMPVVVEKYGMIRGVKDLTEQINNAGKLKTELIVTGFENENSISVNLQMHIYRIVQELMNNIIKHSDGTHALLQLVEHDNSVSLIVEDNGIGLIQKKDSGNGLHILSSKIEILNGEMNVESQPGNGTSFIIEIPKNTNTPLLYEKNENSFG